MVDRITEKKYKSRERTITNLKLNYGEYKILYKKNIINIIFKKVGHPLGLSYTTEHHEELLIKIKYKDIKDKLCKEKILQNFLKDSENILKLHLKKKLYVIFLMVLIGQHYLNYLKEILIPLIYLKKILIIY